MLNRDNKETRGNVWAVEMTPPCLLMTYRARMGYTSEGTWTARDTCTCPC